MKTKSVESFFIACLDEGSIPSSSTKKWKLASIFLVNSYGLMDSCLGTIFNLPITINVSGPIVQWIECKIPVLMIWVRIPVGSQKVVEQ